MKLAPIVLFVYNRPLHTKQTLLALKENVLANESSLYIYADGPKSNASERDLIKINETRNILKSEQWCKEVNIYESDINKGCDDSIIESVTKIINQFGKIIVLEDDIVTSTGFLKYMNEALMLYEKEDRIMYISGYMFPLKVKLPETFLFNTSSFWGWATWKRAWNKFENKADTFMLNIINNNKIDDFNFDGNFDYFEQLRLNAEGKIYTWDVKWYALIFISNCFGLYPNRSLVQNIGHDLSGLHCGVSLNHHWDKLADRIKVNKIKIKENRKARIAMSKFGRNDSKTISFKSIILTLIQKNFLNLFKYLLFVKHRELYKIKKYSQFKDLRNSSFKIFENPIKIYRNDEFLFLYEEIFIQEILKFKSDNVNPLIVDIGSNIGLSLIYFKKLYPNSKIIAYESDGARYDLLRQNIDSFNLTHIEVYSNNLFDLIHKIKRDNNHIDLLRIDLLDFDNNILNYFKDFLITTDKIFIRYKSKYNKEQDFDKILNTLTESGFRYFISQNSYKSLNPFYLINIGAGIDNQLNVFTYRK